MAAEPGRVERSSGYYITGMFGHVQSQSDFAKSIFVPEESMPLVEPMNISCKTAGCNFPAVECNRMCCVIHGRSWYPLILDRGGGLFGLQFLRPTTGKVRTCDCDTTSCKLAGYFPSSQSAIAVPAEGRHIVISTPNLFTAEHKKAYLTDDKKEIRLYPWHHFPNNVKQNKEGKWRVKFDKKSRERFYDKERRAYPYPPPRNIAKEFIDEVYPSYISPKDRWAENSETMPEWMWDVLTIDADNNSKNDIEGESPMNNRTPTRNTKARSPQVTPNRGVLSSSQMQRQITMWQKRAHHLHDDNKRIEGEHQRELAGTRRKYIAVVDGKDAEMKKQKVDIARLEHENERLEKLLEECRELLKKCREGKGKPLGYNDLYDGGILLRHVGAFTLFDTAEINDLFLQMINYADGSDGSLPVGDGLCENLRRYSRVSWEERSGDQSPRSIDPDSEEYKGYLKRSKAARSTGCRNWKDDYLAFCIYVRAGTTQEFAQSICGISGGRMSDIFHEWSRVLADALTEMFPRPTRSQLLRAYPTRFLEADGHARCSLLLDAFEVFTQSSSNPNVASSTYSDYKKHNTVKFLGGCDPIGCPYEKAVSDGWPGRASDAFMTGNTKILRQVHFGNTAKVDKRFLVNNIAAGEGVDIDRPDKRKRKQVQQSSVDTSQTQKIGNTRIIVENVNGDCKLQIRHLNVLIPCHQFGVISKIVRIGYLLQNFKCAVIQNRVPVLPGSNVDDADVDGVSDDGRPCRGEIRWYGATDNGLRDVRDNICLWGMNCEIKRHQELSGKEENKNKSPIEISEMILNERWDLNMRRQLHQALYNREYDGGDL